MDPCWLAFRRQAASGAPFGLSMGPRCDLLCLLRCLVGPFARPSKPFAAPGLHFFGIQVALISSFPKSISRMSLLDLAVTFCFLAAWLSFSVTFGCHFLFDTFLDPCWTHAGLLFGQWGAIWSLH